MVGQTGRVFLTYNTENHLLPASIVIKLSRKDLVGRIINVNAQVYKEIFFYQAFAGSTPLKIPELLYSSRSVPFARMDFILMTEDIHPSKTIVDVFAKTILDPHFSRTVNDKKKCKTLFFKHQRC